MGGKDANSTTDQTNWRLITNVRNASNTESDLSIKEMCFNATDKRTIYVVVLIYLFMVSIYMC